MHPRSLFSLVEHLKRLSNDGDPLEIWPARSSSNASDHFLPAALAIATARRVVAMAFDPVAMFKVLMVQVQHDLSDARIEFIIRDLEFIIRDRLSGMRFFGIDWDGAMPDRNTIYHYRNRLTESDTLDSLMQASEQQLRDAGYLTMGEQVVEDMLVRAPTQRNTDYEKAAINTG